MAVASEHISYDFSSVEAKWQAVWQASGQFETPDAGTDRPAAYVFVSLPFTSGQIHVGHVRSYAIADADARFRRTRGEAVLFAIGFDAFGLPAEISATERGMDPAEWVEKCQADMREQLEARGFSFDWSRCFSTAAPDTWAFLLRLWSFAIPRVDATSPWQIDTTSHMRRRLKGWCDIATERITENLVALDTHRATRNVMTLLERIMDFERRLLESESELNTQDRQAISTSLLLLTRLLAPLAPHLAEELWERSGADHSVADADWPAI